MPSGFGIDSFVPAPGWTRQVQSTGSGDSAIVQTVTWTGGATPTGRGLAVPVPRPAGAHRHLHVPGQADLLRRLDRRLVGLRVCRGPGADDQGRVSIGGGRHLDPRPSSRLVLAVLALISGGRGAVRRAAEGRARARMTDGAAGCLCVAPRSWRLMVTPAVASAHAYLVKTVPTPACGPGHSASTVAAHLRRGRRAAVRDHLGHRRRGRAADHRTGQPLAIQPRHAGRAAEAHLPTGLVPDLLAGDLGRRPPRAGRLHVRRRAVAGPAAAVPDPAHLRDGDRHQRCWSPAGRCSCR